MRCKDREQSDRQTENRDSEAQIETERKTECRNTDRHVRICRVWEKDLQAQI